MNVRRVLSAAGALLLALLAGPGAGVAQAHERRTADSVQFVVGWANEPAYAGFLNAVQLRRSDAAGPVTDVGDALKVEVRFGDQKVGPVALAPAFGSPGEYRPTSSPPRAGTYAFHFTGTVRGRQVDQTFTSSDTTFDSAKEPSEIEFPVKDPTRAQLAGRLERIEPRIDTAGAAAKADDAASAANRATVIALAALLVGVAGTGLAVTGRRRRYPGPVLDRQPTGSRAGG